MVPRSSSILQTETPVLIAAKMGIIEMVEKILETFSVAVEDKDSNHMNIVLLAVKHRQPHVYQFMLEFLSAAKESVFGCVDKNGNSALHIAGKVNPGIIPKVTLQMQWAIKWYKVQIHNSINLVVIVLFFSFSFWNEYVNLCKMLLLENYYCDHNYSLKKQ